MQIGVNTVFWLLSILTRHIKKFKFSVLLLLLAHHRGVPSHSLSLMSLLSLGSMSLEEQVFGFMEPR